MNVLLSSASILVAATAAASLTLPSWFYFKVRAKLHSLTLIAGTQAEALEGLADLKDQIASLRSRLECLEEKKDGHAEWLAEAESLNLNKRGQVLRLHKGGSSVGEISSALRVGPGEVKLIIKVFELNRDSPDIETGVF